ncbi:hypothetical protein [Kocuria marina]|uniref:hypothetical protein n=1 Tax=Kocuria marina TaxID=223184 RepID=UPI003F2855A2
MTNPDDFLGPDKGFWTSRAHDAAEDLTSPRPPGLTYDDPGDPQRFYGSLAKCFTIADLQALPAGTRLWGSGSTQGENGWGVPYTASGNNEFWDWGNDCTVGADDIATPAYALPRHPFEPFIDALPPLSWVDAQIRRERAAAALVLEEFAEDLERAGDTKAAAKARKAAAEQRVDDD